jgi:Uncharacterised protein family (UPF0149)
MQRCGGQASGGSRSTGSGLIPRIRCSAVRNLLCCALRPSPRFERKGRRGSPREDFGRRVQQALGFTAANQGRRQEWILDPEAKGPGLIDAERTLSRVIAHRVWVDQRRGWRFTNPSLEELGLIRASYVGLDELATDNAAFENGPVELRVATPDQRRQALFVLLETLRSGLAVTADALDPAEVDSTANASRQRLREPWSISAQENPRVAAALIIDAPRRAETGLRGEPLIVRGSSRSRLARQLGHPRIWAKRLDAKTYVKVVEALLTAAASYEMVRAVGTSFDVEGWRLAANAIRLVEAEGRSDGRAANSYFVSLYRSLADALASGAGFLFGLDGREHTAQVFNRYSEVSETLADRPQAYRPIFMTDDDGSIVARDWAVGFALGIGLRSKEWGRCILLTEHRQLLIPILVYCEGALDLLPDMSAAEKRRRQTTAHAEIAQTVVAARDICNPYRAAEARQPAKRRRASRPRR